MIRLFLLAGKTADDEPYHQTGSNNITNPGKDGLAFIALTDGIFVGLDIRIGTDIGVFRAGRDSQTQQQKQSSDRQELFHRYLHRAVARVIQQGFRSG